MRVIGIGLNKTGTTSLGKAIEILGYKKHYSWDTSNVQKLEEGRVDDLLDFAGSYNNLEDFPWPALYKELDERYDDAMFILTKRKSPETWYNSQCKHYHREFREETLYINKVMYGYENPLDHKDEYLHKYHNHNSEVKKYFQGRSNFLEVCWENGDGWNELCQFLKTKKPNEKFPFLNQAPTKNIVKKIYRKLTQ